MPRRTRTGPVYLQVAATLRDQIKAKRFLPAEYLPSERQMAERFGVTQVTLRRALALLREEGLVVSEPRRGNRVACSPTPVTRCVNLCFFKGLSPFEDPVLSRLCTGIASACSMIGYKLELTYLTTWPGSGKYVEWFRRRLAEITADGVVVVGSPEYYSQTIEEIESRFPTVLVGAPYRAKRADVIEPDYERAMETAVRHAAELDGRQLVLLTDAFADEPGHDQRNQAAFSESARAAGVPEERLLVWRSDAEAAAVGKPQTFYVSEKLVRSLRPPAVLIATAASLAINAVSVLHEAGLRIPQDVAILSSQDDTRLGFIRPPITGVEILGQRVGELAVTRLRERLDNVLLPRCVERGTPTLMVRGSCEEFSVAQPDGMSPAEDSSPT